MCIGERVARVLDIETIMHVWIEDAQVDRLTWDDKPMDCQDQDSLGVVIRVQKKVDIPEIGCLIVRDGRGIPVVGGAGVVWLEEEHGSAQHRGRGDCSRKRREFHVL